MLCGFVLTEGPASIGSDAAEVMAALSQLELPLEERLGQLPSVCQTSRLHGAAGSPGGEQVLPRAPQIDMFWMSWYVDLEFWGASRRWSGWSLARTIRRSTRGTLRGSCSSSRPTGACSARAEL